MDGGPPPNLPNIMVLTVAQLQQRYWRLLDIAVPHILYRWLGFGGLFLVYMLRVWMLQGWYIVTYGLGIHILNLFIGFITPQVRVACILGGIFGSLLSWTGVFALHTCGCSPLSSASCSLSPSLCSLSPSLYLSLSLSRSTT
jgi:hypothetical protein